MKTLEQLIEKTQRMEQLLSETRDIAQELWTDFDQRIDATTHAGHRIKWLSLRNFAKDIWLNKGLAVWAFANISSETVQLMLDHARLEASDML